MYSLFYAGYLLFGGMGLATSAMVGVNTLRKHEEKHSQQLYEASIAGYWQGYGDAWPLAYKQGEVGMLQICQSLATESIDMVGADFGVQAAFNQLVASWPQYALETQLTTE